MFNGIGLTMFIEPFDTESANLLSPKLPHLFIRSMALCAIKMDRFVTKSDLSSLKPAKDAFIGGARGSKYRLLITIDICFCKLSLKLGSSN